MYFGNYERKKLLNLIDFILCLTGLSVTKTLAELSVCDLKELIRVNNNWNRRGRFVGGFRLKNGQTVWSNGHHWAMEECVFFTWRDWLASNKIMCLQQGFRYLC